MMSYGQVTVKRKRDGIFGLVGRAFSMIIGMGLVSIGVVLMCTIIGLLPGFGVGMSGLLMMKAASTSKQVVKCPNCRKKNMAIKDVVQMKCTKCQAEVPINWIR